MKRLLFTSLLLSLSLSCSLSFSMDKPKEKPNKTTEQEQLKKAIVKYDLECDSNNKEDLLKKIGIILDNSPELVNIEGDPTFDSPITLWFTAEGKLELLKLFISKGADPEKRDLMELNTLDVAVYFGRDKIVKYLVEEVGLKISNNLVGFAQKQGHKKIAKYLQKKQNERDKELILIPADCILYLPK